MLRVCHQLHYNTSTASSASDFTLRTVHCSVFVVVVHAAGCDKYRPRFTDASQQVRGEFSQYLFTGTARHRSKQPSQLSPTTAIYAFHTCIRCPRQRGPCRTIAMAFDIEKLEWFGYPMLRKIQLCLVPLFSYLTLTNIVTLKPGLEVTRGHSNWYHLKAWMQFPIHLPQ